MGTDKNTQFHLVTEYKMEDRKMKNEELAKLFKFCLLNVSSASLNTRKNVINELSHLLENDSVTEGHLKGVAKILILTLHRYRNKKSRLLVLSFLEKSFIKLHDEKAALFLLNETSTVLEKLQGGEF